MYPPAKRSTLTMVVCGLIALVAIVGACYPGAMWQQRVGCVAVALVGGGMVVLEWRKPPKRPKGGKRRAR